MRQEINIVDNRPAGILQKNIVPGEGWAQLQIGQGIPVQQKKNVAQLAKIKILRVMKMDPYFNAYLQTKGWVIDTSGCIDTGEGGLNQQGLSLDFIKFKELKKKAEADAEIQMMEEKRRNVIEAAEQCVKGKYPEAPPLSDSEGKNNVGIYNIPASLKNPVSLIVKLVRKSNKEGLTVEKRMEKFKQIQSYKEKYHPDTSDGWELNVPVDEVKVIGSELFTVYILTYKKQLGETLEKRIKGGSVPNGGTIGEKAARFHCSAYQKTKQFLVHNDFNTTNIMMGDGDLMGLIDTDDVQLTDIKNW